MGVFSTAPNVYSLASEANAASITPTYDALVACRTKSEGAALVHWSKFRAMLSPEHALNSWLIITTCFSQISAFTSEKYTSVLYLKQTIFPCVGVVVTVVVGVVVGVSVMVVLVVCVVVGDVVSELEGVVDVVIVVVVSVVVAVVVGVVSSHSPNVPSKKELSAEFTVATAAAQFDPTEMTLPICIVTFTSSSPREYSEIMALISLAAGAPLAWSARTYLLFRTCACAWVVGTKTVQLLHLRGIRVCV